MSIKVAKILPEFIDARGTITRVLDQRDYPIQSILFIQRKKGTVGANHYHKSDAHFLYVLTGKIKHFEKDVKDKNGKLESVILKPGDLVLVPPMTAHKDEFLEDTNFFAFTTESRNQHNYEKDTVRIEL